MNNGWQTVRLDELTEADSPITYGVVKPGDPGDVLFIRGGDLADGRVLSNQLRTITRAVSEQYSRTLLRGGELLMCLVGQPGQVAVAPLALAGANIARQVGLIRLRSEIDAEFISYFLQSPDGQASLRTHTGGSVQQVINLGDLRTVNVPVPHLAEQRRIVGILDEAFEGLATAKANAEQNLQNARALFKSHLQAVFTQRGDGWVVCQLADCLELITYGFTNPMPTTESGPYMVTAKNVNGGRVDYATARRTSQEAFEKLLTDKSRPKIGDVLLTKDGTLGRLAVVERADLCINQSVALLRPNDRMVPHFMRILLSAPNYQHRMAGDADGATIKHIYITRVDKMDVAFPPIKEQMRIVTSIGRLASESQRLESLYQRKLAALDELKKSLLHRAFSGQL